MRLDLGLVGLAGCFADWMLTRPWKQVLLCFLPLLFGLAVIGLVGAGRAMDRDKLAARYLAIADREVADWEKQWAPAAGAAADDKTANSNASTDGPPKPVEIPNSAEMLYRRVQQIHQNDARSTFFVAMCYLQRGAVTQAFSMLSRIAPSDRVGYLPAHAMIAENLLTHPVKVGDLPIVKHHAEAAMRWDRTAPNVLVLISELFAKIQEPGKSIAAMRQAAERDPKFHILLAQIAGGDKKYAKFAEESLEKATTHFAKLVESNSQDVQSRLMLAKAYETREDFQNAERTLLDGLKLVDNQQLKSELSEVYRQVFIKTSRFTDNSWSGDIELLDKAYRLDPNNLRIYDHVAGLASMTGTVASEELMGQLRKNLAAGHATSITHMWIAEHYLRTNLFDKAIPHLEQAVKRDPSASRCWNNLAYCLADRDPNRLEEALQCANHAVTLAAEVPDYHDTRGTILMKLNRPGDAIAAFEHAIEAAAKRRSQFPMRPEYHTRLAEAYSAAGDQAMANTHKEFAAELTRTIENARAALNKDVPANAVPAKVDGQAPLEPSTKADEQSNNQPQSSDPSFKL